MSANGTISLLQSRPVVHLQVRQTVPTDASTKIKLKYMISGYAQLISNTALRGQNK